MADKKITDFEKLLKKHSIPRPPKPQDLPPAPSPHLPRVSRGT